MSLAVTIFALVFLTELVSWIGKRVLLDLCYTVHEHLFLRGAVRRQGALKKDILSTKHELLQTSAQDQFAKWARLRRRVDKGLEELEKLNSELAARKTVYGAKFNTALWLTTSGAQYVLGWWFGKTAVFYLPSGWFGPAEWTLSLLFAPLGSVSCAVWQLVCKRVLNVARNVLNGL